MNGITAVQREIYPAAHPLTQRWEERGSGR
jgi:hypothetical protein